MAILEGFGVVSVAVDAGLARGSPILARRRQAGLIVIMPVMLRCNMQSGWTAATKHLLL
jgi:hypothetical protein